MDQEKTSLDLKDITMVKSEGSTIVLVLLILLAYFLYKLYGKKW